jgi:hypothetical protein
MSVATLIGGTLKTRQTCAREAQTARVELPEKTTRGRLVAMLGEFEGACSELSDYAARAERARIDADRAMEDAGLTETEAAEKIQTFQLQGNVYKARQAQREKAIASLSKELTSAIGQANSELQGLVNREVDRRREILGARVLAAAGVADTSRPGLAPALADLLDYSEPIERTKALEPSPVIQTAGNHEILVQAAKDALAKHERVIAEAGKRI